MQKRILIHGSGYKAASWKETISYLNHREDILCPELANLLNGREASYSNLRTAFAEYCTHAGESIHLCGLSLGGILALDHALEHPEQVETLVLIGTPHKVPKAAFALQNVVFRFLPKSMFTSMAFDKKDTFALGNTMKDLDFSGRLGEIQCPTLILCGEKDSANLKSAHFLT
ncbi:alpha/beta hydrolase [Flavonifractor sp. An100]|uniref:alpha/beta fold hydrolase n=1 Tax=Flavonifractor sp. An100 TaxID=1965538 RepID=UPI001FA91E05|nr:alpha/beta hydrolase [Flavonifractor sp. An100]